MRSKTTGLAPQLALSLVCSPASRSGSWSAQRNAERGKDGLSLAVGCSHRRPIGFLLELLGPRFVAARVRYHTDDSIEVKYYGNPEFLTQVEMLFLVYDSGEV